MDLKADNEYIIIDQDNKIKIGENTDIYDFAENYNGIIPKNQIIEFYQKKFHEKSERELDGLESTEIDDDDVDRPPYNPENVGYALKLFSVLTLFNYISGYEGDEEPTINLRPDFQRNFVWTNRAKSLLIESMLLNIPIPSIYLNQNSSESYLPADGLQRLNAIYEFMSGNLKLSGLEYLSNLNGFKYKKIRDNDKELPIHIKRKIRDYQITCFVINSSTPDEVKLDIFKRLNTTGIRLSPQELRNSVTSNRIRDFYKKIEENEYFKELVSSAVNTNRFVHHEFILRFAGAYLWQVKNEISYNGNMNTFLDKLLIYMKSLNNYELNEIENVYYKVLFKAYWLFGKDAFRKPYKKRKGPINTLLYTQILINLLNVDIGTTANKEAGIFKSDLDNILNTDSKLLLSISSATNNNKNIQFVDLQIKKLLNEIMGDYSS